MPEEFRAASFAEDFEFRAKAALRTWQRPHAIEKLTPELGTGDVRGGEDFNFDISNKVRVHAPSQARTGARAQARTPRQRCDHRAPPSLARPLAHADTRAAFVPACDACQQ